MVPLADVPAPVKVSAYGAAPVAAPPNVRPEQTGFIPATPPVPVTVTDAVPASLKTFSVAPSAVAREKTWDFVLSNLIIAAAPVVAAFPVTVKVATFVFFWIAVEVSFEVDTERFTVPSEFIVGPFSLTGKASVLLVSEEIVNLSGSTDNVSSTIDTIF